MDPLDPNSFRHKFSIVNGITLHFVDEGEERNEAIVLCHGFPDLWYGWRYQIPVLVKKGYRVIVPDLRGFGQTDAPRCPPENLQLYGFKNICQDLVELTEQLNIRTAIYCGHDWGGMVVWRMAQYHPERVRAVISICTFYTPPRDHYLSVEDIAREMPSFQYQIYLSHPKAEIELDSNVETALKALIRSSKKEEYFKLFDGKVYLGSLNKAPKSAFISDKELDYYIAQYKARGFHGALNWYKTRKVNYQDEKGLRREINTPSLMITAGKDNILKPEFAKDMPKYCSDLVIEHVEESGHWMMIEQPQKLNEIITAFLDKLKTRTDKAKI
ncbi:1242_t:CDS:10 [Ambispora leptoticha]|uniref:1242_t:CDS:1 n=1 Tax=Ambispora leptoticha TaxID=144679 RepID=A0A9N8ZDW1_9GLOM|nr:1242_t:CDS:10 [Ambispora leptoticha]